MTENEEEVEPSTEALEASRRQDYPTETLRRLLKYPMPKLKHGDLIDWERFSEMEEEDFMALERKSKKSPQNERGEVFDVVDSMNLAESFWLGHRQCRVIG